LITGDFDTHKDLTSLLRAFDSLQLRLFKDSVLRRIKLEVHLP